MTPNADTPGIARRIAKSSPTSSRTWRSSWSPRGSSAALFARFGQPRVVGEIIAGILIGPTVLGGQLAKGAVTALDKPAVAGDGLIDDLYPLQAFAFLNLIGLLALVFFMFLVGLEVQQRFLQAAASGRS